MRTLLLFAATALLPAGSLSAQSGTVSPETNTVRRQIEANQQAVNRAVHARDFSELLKFWSPQMVVNAPENTIRTRDDVIADMRSGGLSYTSLKGTPESFKVLGDIAIEMGHEDFVMASGPAAGKPLQRRYTNVWQRTGGHWVQIARQATILNADEAWVYGSASASPQSETHQ